MALTRWRLLVGPYRYLAVYVIIGFVLEAVLYYTSTFLHVNNLWVVHLYVPVQFLFLSAVYYQVLSPKRIRIAILVLSGLVLAVSVLNAFMVGGLLLFNTYASAMASAVLILYALFYFDQVFRELRVKRLERDPVFLLSAGSLLYFSGTILGSVFMNTLLAESMTVAWVIYFINRGLSTVFKIVLALALWLAARQETERPAAPEVAGRAGMRQQPLSPPQG